MIRNIRIKTIIILSSLILVFCAPHKRLNRILDKYPHLKENALDTLILRDSLIVQDYVHDTTTIIETHDTTIIINNEKVFAKYIFDTITKEIHHHIECKGDTIRIIKEIPFEVEKIKYIEPEPYDKYLKYAIFLVAGLIILALLKQIKSLFS